MARRVAADRRAVQLRRQRRGRGRRRPGPLPRERRSVRGQGPGPLGGACSLRRKPRTPASRASTQRPSASDTPPTCSRSAGRRAGRCTTCSTRSPAALQAAGRADDDSYTILKDTIHLTDPAYVAWGYFLYERFDPPPCDCHAALTAAGKVTEATRCRLTDVSAADGVLRFTRRDEVLPLLPPVELPPRKRVPMERLSPYRLTVTVCRRVGTRSPVRASRSARPTPRRGGGREPEFPRTGCQADTAVARLCRTTVGGRRGRKGRSHGLDVRHSAQVGQYPAAHPSLRASEPRAARRSRVDPDALVAAAVDARRARPVAAAVQLLDHRVRECRAPPGSCRRPASPGLPVGVARADVLHPRRFAGLPARSCRSRSG